MKKMLLAIAIGLAVFWILFSKQNKKATDENFVTSENLPSPKNVEQKQPPPATHTDKLAEPTSWQPKNPEHQNPVPQNTIPITKYKPQEQTVTDRFIKKYMEGNIEEMLRQSTPLTEFGEINASVLATRSAFLINTPSGSVRIFSSFGTEAIEAQVGCVSIRDIATTKGSLVDRSARLIKLPDEDAFGIVVRNNQLIVFYGNAATWGQQLSNEEPRVLLYYKRKPEKPWIFQGKGVSGINEIPTDAPPELTHEEFCDLP